MRIFDRFWDKPLSEPVKLLSGGTLHTLGDALEVICHRHKSLEAQPVKDVLQSIRTAADADHVGDAQIATDGFRRLATFNRWI